MKLLRREDINKYQNEEKNKINCVEKDSVVQRYKYQFVYLLVTKKKCKIGITSNLKNRLRGLEQNLINDKTVEFYSSQLCTNAKAIESLFFSNFKNDIIKGEWVKLNKDEYLQFLNKCNYKTNFISEEEYKKKKQEGKELVEAFGAPITNGISNTMQGYYEKGGKDIIPHVVQYMKSLYEKEIEPIVEYSEFFNSIFTRQILSILSHIAMEENKNLSDIIKIALDNYMDTYYDRGIQR